MQRQLVELAKRLSDAGEVVEVVLFYGGNPVLEDELRAAHVQLRTMGKTGRWDVIGFLGRLALLVRRSRPDVVYSFLTVPNVLAGLLRPMWRPSRIVWGVRDSH